MSNENESKITRFRSDRRLSVISFIRSLCLAGLLMTVIFCIFAYQEDLNISNLRRIVSYIDRLTFDGRPTDVFSFDSGTDTGCAAFDVGIAVCSKGSFRFIPPFENMEYSHQIKHSSPHMEPCGSSILVYDLGGTGISRFNSYSLLAETNLESDIISLSANDSGKCVVVTDEKGYRTGVTVLDKHLKPEYTWQTSEHFAFMAALNPSSSMTAVLCIGQKDGESSFFIRFQPTDGGECKHTAELGDMKVYSMRYSSDSRLTVIGEKGVFVYNDKGELKNSFEFSKGALVTFSHHKGNACALSLKGEKGDTSRVVVLDQDCEVIFDKTAEGSVRSIDLSGDVLAFIASDGVHQVSLSKKEEKIANLSGVRGVIITGGESAAAIYSDCAVTVPFEQEAE